MEDSPNLPRITRIKTSNYRVLKDVTLDGLTPFTVLLGSNGSGKSSLLDAVRLLTDAVERGTQFAVNTRGGLDAVRTLGSTGPVQIEVGAEFPATGERFDYHVTFDVKAESSRPFHELLDWTSTRTADYRTLLEFHSGEGVVYEPSRGKYREAIEDDSLALATFGRLSRFEEIAKFRKFVLGWASVDIDVGRVRAGSLVDPRWKDDFRSVFSPDGADTARLLERMSHTTEFAEIVRSLRRYIPKLESVSTEQTSDGRLVVKLKDQTFDGSAPSEAISEGTLRLLAQLVVLRQHGPSALLVEEPESNLHPNLHYGLAEDFRLASETTPLIAATHSPRFVNAVRPEELWVLARGANGYGEARRAADLPVVMAMVRNGGELGDLWTEGLFDAGFPAEGP
jgi:predicted ATPase